MAKTPQPAPVPRKTSWAERVVDIENFHKSRLRANIKHTLRDTAKELGRSYGSIQADIELASWLKTHPSLANIKNAADALAFIRERKLERRVR